MNPLPVLVLTTLLLTLWLFSRRKKQSTQKPFPSANTSERTSSGTDNPNVGSDRDFDVFINFRGPDSRHTVADVLYNSLRRAGIRVFRDDEEIRKGEVIRGELLGAITNSKIYIPIFSKNYASSKWCLRELAKMIDCWETSSIDTKKVIFPIFYDVDVSEDLKLRSQVYTTALQKHKKELGDVAVKPWEDALKKVATIKGWNLKDHGLSELTDLIIEKVFTKITPKELTTSLSDRLVGIDKPVKDIMELLEEGFPGVRFIVIHGLGGIGKTTLAEVVFKKISSRFHAGCFLRDIGRSASVNGLVKLQENILLDTLNLNSIKVSDVDHGIDIISSRLRDKNVLIVLDDVEKRDHLLKLAAKSYWFGPKSRIIITTRNIDFLPNKDDKEYSFYAMKEMDERNALKLFCKHAFEKDLPPPEYHDISIEIVVTTGGLPLALEVIGSSLHDQDIGTWKFRLEKLKEAPHKDVQETLMISYQALEYEQQQIFLDIACLFNDEEMIYLFYFWEACNFYPDSNIKSLAQRSLIKVHDGGMMWMHDQLRDLGRIIAQPKMSTLVSRFPVEPSRLWSPECALDALRNKEVDKNIMALKLGKLDAGCHFAPDEFASANKLKYLQLQGGNFEGDFKQCFQQLRWLSWSDCPLKFEATNLNLKNLVVLKLSSSQVDEDWAGWGMFKEAKHLKVVHLEDCKRLKKSSNFSTNLQLERLILRDCSGLEEIDRSNSKLKHLKYLEISNNYVIHWPCEVPERSQLLSHSIGGLKFLTELKIEKVGLKELHPSIGELVNLKLLYLRQCPLLEYLPSTIGKLMLLEKLNLHESGIKGLPDTIGSLKSLEELHLNETRIALLPETITNLKRLKVIAVSDSPIKMLPNDLIKLENLEELWAAGCWEMDINLPEEIGKLSGLRTLDIRETKISRVPTTINQLSYLETLYLSGIQEPQELLRLPTGLKSLSVESQSLKLHQVPDLSYMTNLVHLELLGGTRNGVPNISSPSVQTTPVKWLARFPTLDRLKLVLPDIMSPPIELSSFSCLRSLEITCYNPQSLTHVPASLKTLDLYDIRSPIERQLLSSLNNLSNLTLENCWLKEMEIDCLEQLNLLCVNKCKTLERLSIMSSLKELLELHFGNNPHLVDIEGVGELKSLQSLTLWGCNSIQRLPDLSRLKKLTLLGFYDCESLECIPEVDEEASCYLELANCKRFHDFSGPYSERHRAITT